MTHLYLIRHADYIYDLVDGDYPKRDQGLSPLGREQAEKLRARLARTGEIQPDVFVSSPERGARETAEVIASAIGAPLTLDKDVEEWRSEDGTLSDEEFMGAWKSLSDADRPYHRWVEGCETLLEFSLRVNVALNRILKEHRGRTVLIVTHGAFIQAAFAHFLGTSLAVPQRAVPDVRRTSITHWIQNAEQSRWTLERSNDDHHLS
ncbi:MAG: histidine phosphatase family protein [Candidatus Eisenbacteria bacterium]|uniref:Histidine phosphatase family protein n=1 Tax=Eiseniibacteriota bacterium TaxID=2212470 RepID=A0A956SGR7_UNCEI|nr:histidine phosphatase family protein [Candidatus Eisenbacteria bacterium]